MSDGERSFLPPRSVPFADSPVRKTAKRNNAEYLRKLRAIAVANGLCSECRCRPQKPGRVSCETCLEKHSARAAKRKTAGLCECGREPIANHTRCQRCIDRGNAQAQRYKESHDAAGLCRMCPQKAEPDRTMCAKHLHWNAQKSREIQGAYHTVGLCYCGREPIPDRVLCERCAKRNATRARARRERHVEAGLCVSCNEPAKKPFQSCDRHLEIARAYRRAWEKARRERAQSSDI